MVTQAGSSSLSQTLLPTDSAPIPSTAKLPLLLIALPPVLVVGVYLAIQAYMRHLSSIDPIPNQGAMLVAFFVMVGTAILATIIMLVGGVLWLKQLIRHRNPK